MFVRYMFFAVMEACYRKNITNILLFEQNVKLLLFEIICIRIWYLVPNISSYSNVYRYTYVRVYGNRLDKLADPWFLLITAYSTTLIQLENGEISRYGVYVVTQCPHSLFSHSTPVFHASEFNIRMKFYRDTLVNRSPDFSWFNSRRDFSRKKGEEIRRRGISILYFYWGNYLRVIMNSFWMIL